MKKALLLATVLLVLKNILLAQNNADSATLYKHVTYLCAESSRNFYDTASLNRVGKYIKQEFQKYNTRVEEMPFEINGKIYKNIVTSYGPENAPRIIIGAHYDVCGNQAGADDNASGIAGLLELSRLLALESSANMQYRIDLVAYTLEEPPTYGSLDMGSAHHAQYLKEKGITVYGMICLEMIGYYTDVPHTQSFPADFLKIFYGNTGNFITIVRKIHTTTFTRQFTRKFKNQNLIRTKVFRGPTWVQGIDFSDHRNFWNFNWDALMITDTAFYRNKNYHKSTDIPDTLNYIKIASVVNSLYKAILAIT